MLLLSGLLLTTTTTSIVNNLTAQGIKHYSYESRKCLMSAFSMDPSSVL